MLVDSHCHLNRLDLSAYQGNLSIALQAARQRDVKHFLCVSVVLDEFSLLMDLAKNQDDISLSLGLHPTEPAEREPTIEELVQLGSNKKVVAIGETGLDFYRAENEEEKTLQRNRFRQHIRVAKIVKKPLIVHTRQAQEDTIAILKEEGAKEVGGVMHCFTETIEMARLAMQEDFYISFSGIVTFHNAANLKEVAKQVPLDKMLIETDSPYLAPVPYRGKSNQPAYVREVAEYLAMLKAVPYEKLADTTTDNFFQLFNAAKNPNLPDNLSANK